MADAEPSDLPHNPRKPISLYYRAIDETKNLENIYHSEVEAAESHNWEKPTVALYAAVSRCTWGAKVTISWRAPELEYCHCQSAGCQELHEHSIKKSTYKISSDATLILFQKCMENEIMFFRSIFRSCRERVLSDD